MTPSLPTPRLLHLWANYKNWKDSLVKQKSDFQPRIIRLKIDLVTQPAEGLGKSVLSRFLVFDWEQAIQKKWGLKTKKIF